MVLLECSILEPVGDFVAVPRMLGQNYLSGSGYRTCLVLRSSGSQLCPGEYNYMR